MDEDWVEHSLQFSLWGRMQGEGQCGENSVDANLHSVVRQCLHGDKGEMGMDEDRI